MFLPGLPIVAAQEDQLPLLAAHGTKVGDLHYHRPVSGETRGTLSEGTAGGAPGQIRGRLKELQQLGVEQWQQQEKKKRKAGGPPDR